MRTKRDRGQSAFEFLLLATGAVLFVILTVSVVRSGINTNANAANNTAGGYQNFVSGRAADILVRDSCVAGWPFSEGSGTTTADASGNNHTGTLINGVTWTTGINGNAVKIGGYGSNQHINVSTFSIANEITVSAWVNSSDYGTGYTWVIVKEPADWQLFSAYDVLNWRGGSATAITCTAPSINVWHHIAVTQSGTTAKFYIDGAQCTSGTVDALGNGGGKILIGGLDSAPSNSFAGPIDELAVYNRALNPSEITALYRAKTLWCG